MRKTKLFFTILFCCFSLTANALQITSLPNAEITTDIVLLKDIVRFSEDTPLTTALASRRIASAPAIGKSLILQTREVQKMISSDLDLNNNLVWKGSSSTEVKRKAVHITATDIAKSIDSFLRENRNALPEAAYSFIPRQLTLPFNIPTGDLIVSVVPSNPAILGSKRFSLIYTVNDKIVKNISVRGHLKVMAPVAVLTRQVKRGSILRPDMVKMEIKDLSTLRTPCTDLRRVLGKRLTKRLRTGSVLDLSFIEFPPVIHKGQLVKMVVRQNGLQLTATGISYKNGKQNEIIRVKNIRSNKNVFCKVVSPGLVEVQI